MEKISQIPYLLPFAVSLLTTLLVIPILIRFSYQFGLIDKPGNRKIHATAIPAVGGIAILTGLIFGSFFSGQALLFVSGQITLIVASLVLFVAGVLDDRMNIRPLYRLFIQLGCSFAVAASGIRITSLYGFLGIEEIGITGQYMLTVLIITGSTNAFNLIDGLDGLAGGLMLINVLIMAACCLHAGNEPLLIMLIIIAGALLGFLKNNIHPAKIFMGDSGSLMLGFFISGAGIYLIERAGDSSPADSGTMAVIVSALLIVPVFDSLRVYIWRMRRGESPFKADKTHLHHLFLAAGIDHKKTSLLIYVLEILIVLAGYFFRWVATISLAILAMGLLFLGIGYLLQINSEVERWLKKIREMESDNQ